MLRLGLAVIAFAFPLVLWIGGYFLAKLPLADSMSAYYHHAIPILHPGLGVMRNEFVGILFAVGALLFAYQGYSRFEDYALNFAGVFALGIAVFPTKWPADTTGSSFSLHGACAIAFFICIAYVCIWRAGDTLSLIEDETKRNRYRWIYRLLGIAMVVCPFLAWALISNTPSRTSTIFFVELTGIYVFATYWVIKSYEASQTDVDDKSCRGKVQAQPHGVKDVLRPLPVSVQG